MYIKNSQLQKTYGNAGVCACVCVRARVGEGVYTYLIQNMRIYIYMFIYIYIYIPDNSQKFSKVGALVYLPYKAPCNEQFRIGRQYVDMNLFIYIQSLY